MPVITDTEWQNLRLVPDGTLVELAADLDLLVPEVIEKRPLLERCVIAIVRRGRQEGLPFSKYDADDLAALSRDELDAIAELQGVGSGASVRSVMRAGQKVYKSYLKTRPDNPTALMVPSLLRPIARAARDRLDRT